jgi:hypothetical protein
MNVHGKAINLSSATQGFSRRIYCRANGVEVDIFWVLKKEKIKEKGLTES